MSEKELTDLELERVKASLAELQQELTKAQESYKLLADFSSEEEQRLVVSGALSNNSKSCSCLWHDVASTDVHL